MSDQKALILDEAAEIAMGGWHSVEKARAFACSVSDYLLALTSAPAEPARGSDTECLMAVVKAAGPRAEGDDIIDHVGKLAVSHSAISRALSSFEHAERTTLQANIAAKLIEELRSALSQDAPTEPPAAAGAAQAVADALRAEGWAVAVHNDYRLQGVPHTFWLFTKGDRAVKGEGRTDAEALAQVRASLATPAAAAPRQEGLTDRAVKAAISEAIGFDWKQGELQPVNAHDLFNIARAIEAAHGIGAEDGKGGGNG